MRRDGFSLLEAVVALAIVGSVSVASLAAFAAQVRASERARTALEAHALAEERLARVRLLSRDEMVHLPDSLARGRFDAPWERFAWTAESRESTGSPGVLEVGVRVTGNGASYELATRVYHSVRPRAAR